MSQREDEVAGTPDWRRALRRLGDVGGLLIAIGLVLVSPLPSGGLVIAVTLTAVWVVRSPWGHALVSTRKRYYSDAASGLAVRRLQLELGSVRRRLGLRFDDLRVVRHQPVPEGGEVDLELSSEAVVSDDRLIESVGFVLNLDPAWVIECQTVSGAVRRISIVKRAP